jgi:hypothetical protein
MRVSNPSDAVMAANSVPGRSARVAAFVARRPAILGGFLCLILGGCQAVPTQLATTIAPAAGVSKVADGPVELAAVDVELGPIIPISGDADEFHPAVNARGAPLFGNVCRRRECTPRQ